MKPTEHGDHAFLIVAHEDEPMLRRLVTRLSPLGHIFVHIDAKTDITHWQLDDLPCRILENRVRVFWGDWSAVEVTTLLLEAALALPNLTRFTLLSGTHYPIISNEAMDLRMRTCGNVIASRFAPNMIDGSRPEVEYERRFYPTLIPNGVWSMTKNALMNRVVHYGHPLDWRSVAPTTGMRAGSMYWSIDREFAQYCVQRIRSSSPLMDYFRLIVCGDEKVIATLYGEYAREVSQEGTTYSKWTTRPHRIGKYPARLTRGDLEEVISRDLFWFARKFRSSDSEVLDWLDAI